MGEYTKTEEKTERKMPSINSNTKVSAIVPKTLDEAWRYSQSVVAAGMVPDSINGTKEEKTAKVMMVVNKGLEVGLPPQSALSNIMIVNKRPCLWGDGALSLVLNHPKYEWHKEWIDGDFKSDNWTAHCQIKRKDNDEIIHQTFSYGEAKAAKLTGKPGPWMSYPKRMLQMRARAFAIRDGFADALQGLGIVEEQKDVPQPAEKTDTSALDDDFTASIQPKALEHDAGAITLELESESEQETLAVQPSQSEDSLDPADKTHLQSQDIEPVEQDMISNEDGAFPGCQACKGTGYCSDDGRTYACPECFAETSTAAE